MDGINWYMLIYLFLYLFSIYFQKRISRMPASCTINATIIYTSIFIPYTLLYMYSIVHRIPLDCPKRNHRGRFLVAAEHQPFILPCTTTTTTATTPFYRPSTTLYNHLFLVSIISQLHRESLPSHYGRQRFSRRGDGDAGSRREGVCHAEYHPVSCEKSTKNTVLPYLVVVLSVACTDYGDRIGVKAMVQKVGCALELQSLIVSRDADGLYRMASYGKLRFCRSSSGKTGWPFTCIMLISTSVLMVCLMCLDMRGDGLC